MHKLGLCYNFMDHIFLDDVFEAVSQTSFYILATHGEKDAASASDQCVRASSSFHQYRVLSEAVHRLQFLFFLLYENDAVFDDVEGVGVISLVEDQLSFVVGFCETGGCDGVLLLFREIFEEGEDGE